MAGEEQPNDLVDAHMERSVPAQSIYAPRLGSVLAELRCRYRPDATRQPQRLRGLLLRAALVAVALLCAGCGVSPGGFVSSAVQTPFPRLVLTAARSRLLTGAGVSAAETAGNVDPAYALAAFVGHATLNTLQPRVIQLAADPNVTILVVEQTVHGKSQASMFRLNTTRQLRATINGRVVEYIGPREIVITVPRGARAKIVISDAYAGQKIYRQGTLSLRRPMSLGKLFSWLPWLHTRTNVNFDTGQLNVPPRFAELEMNSHYVLSAVNGTTAAPWYGGDTPSQAACESLPSNQYSSRFVELLHTSQSPFDGDWCIHTVGGHYGLLTAAIYNNDSGVPIVDHFFAWKTWTFDYLLWRRR